MPHTLHQSALMQHQEARLQMEAYRCDMAVLLRTAKAAAILCEQVSISSRRCSSCSACRRRVARPTGAGHRVVGGRAPLDGTSQYSVASSSSKLGPSPCSSAHVVHLVHENMAIIYFTWPGHHPGPLACHAVQAHSMPCCPRLPSLAESLHPANLHLLCHAPCVPVWQRCSRSCRAVQYLVPLVGFGVQVGLGEMGGQPRVGPHPACEAQLCTWRARSRPESMDSPKVWARRSSDPSPCASRASGPGGCPAAGLIRGGPFVYMPQKLACRESAN